MRYRTAAILSVVLIGGMFISGDSARTPLRMLKQDSFDAHP